MTQYMALPPPKNRFFSIISKSRLLNVHTLFKMSNLDMCDMLRPLECSICLDLVSNCQLKPCNHDQFCRRCAIVLFDRSITTCPICRSNIASVSFDNLLITTRELPRILKCLRHCTKKDMTLFTPDEVRSKFGDFQFMVNALFLNEDYILGTWKEIEEVHRVLMASGILKETLLKYTGSLNRFYVGWNMKVDSNKALFRAHHMNNLTKQSSFWYNIKLVILGMVLYFSINLRL